MRGANQSRYVSAMVTNQVPINANQNDLNAIAGLIKRDRNHVARLLIKGRMYRPMTLEEQVAAIEYAYDIQSTEKKPLSN
jgi:hypothetical protein